MTAARAYTLSARDAADRRVAPLARKLCAAAKRTARKITADHLQSAEAGLSRAVERDVLVALSFVISRDIRRNDRVDVFEILMALHRVIDRRNTLLAILEKRAGQDAVRTYQERAGPRL